MTDATAIAMTGVGLALIAASAVAGYVLYRDQAEQYPRKPIPPPILPRGDENRARVRRLRMQADADRLAMDSLARGDAAGEGWKADR